MMENNLLESEDKNMPEDQLNKSKTKGVDEKRIRRILVVDDNPSIHEDFKNILNVNLEKKSAIKSLEEELFGDENGRGPGNRIAEPSEPISYIIEDAYQGEEAMKMVDEAVEKGTPYALVFMDVRMPPGIDGIKTIQNIWAKHKNIEMVICTAFSDYSWEDIVSMFGETDHLLFVKKPFISVEIKQIALTLTTKWLLDRERREYLQEMENSLETIKQSKEKLRKKEAEYRNLYETAAIGLFRTRISDGKLLKANKAALKIFGYNTLTKALKDNLKIAEFYPEGKRQEMLGFLESRKTKSNGDKVENIGHFDVHLTFDGNREADAAITLKMYPEEDYVEGSILDISEAKRAEQELIKKEQQLIQAQKMETVGNLAGGLAHDFNNVLGGVIGTVSLLEFGLTQKKQFSKDDILRHIQTIKTAADRAANMVKQLLALSRKHELCLAPVDLNHSIQLVMKICRNSIDKSIKLVSEYTEEKAMVHADATQIEQTILNLCLNASHAMTIMRGPDDIQGGTLTVSLKKIEAGEHFCKYHPEAKLGVYWMLKVSDTGVGMTTPIISKIFDPFFTTKEAYKGSGLGLTMVYNIVKQHKGFIDVYSEAGIGTTFNIFLPVLTGFDESVVPLDQTLDFPKGTGMILVVEDEYILRETAKAILEECGYEIITAENGKEAMDVFKEKHKEIKGVLLDMSMPVMSGKDAYMKLKSIDPNVKVIMTSGYKQDDRVQSVLALGIEDFIQKPYSVMELTQKVNKLVG